MYANAQNIQIKAATMTFRPCQRDLRSTFWFFIDLEIFIMNQPNRFTAGLSAIMLVSVVALAGCAGMTHQEKGTATGAVIGGVAGNVVGGGLLGTAAGAAVGGVIGHEVTKKK